MIASDTTSTLNPLDQWAAQRMGISRYALTRDAILDYQLAAIRETTGWARSQSAFYASRLSAFPQEWPRSLDEFAQAPLTGPTDLIERGHEFLCVPQSEISRVVTLETSGTCGTRKRIFFTAADQERTLDFFACGVTAMAGEGDRMFIALPGEREGSVGFQLARGIARADVEPIPYGLVHDPAEALARMSEERATLLIGLPVQVLRLASEASELADRVFRSLHTIVLCSDHVPQSLVDRIHRVTECEIFEHYGSTEMGLGGGVDCGAHAGYHLREADLRFEIVSPQTGEALGDGELGEVVFTTLGRTGMPLIRYRTGDLSRIIPGPCPCGSPLRRLARVKDRVDSFVSLGSAGGVAMSELDEALFALPGLNDFSATLASGSPNELELRIYAPFAHEPICETARSALFRIPGVAHNLATGDLRLRVLEQEEPFPVTGAKRRIEVARP